MPEINETSVREALHNVESRLAGVTVQPGPAGAHVTFVLEVDPAEGPRLETMRQAAEQSVRRLPGVAQVTAILTAHRAQHAPAHRKPPPNQTIALPGIRHIIAVASGKGGVGKSTTAVNLALALAGQGHRIGLFDADIYGPSIPRMLGIRQKPTLREDKKLDPVIAHALSVMSIGFLLATEDNPLIWRGPMVQGAIQQMLRDVAWRDLDVLVLDLPPGTGDAQLAITQMLPLSGAVIVSTPQDIALLDARRGLHMFQRVNVPVLGIVENMSYFICPHCQGRSEIFSHGGAEQEAAKLGVPFLGAVPLERVIRESMDAGNPIAIAQPESATAKTYASIAAGIWHRLQAAEPKPTGA